MASKKDEFHNTSYVSEDGRVSRVVTSPEEAERLEADGWVEGEVKGREASAANAGLTGHLASALSSTTGTDAKGQARPATSERPAAARAAGNKND